MINTKFRKKLQIFISSTFIDLKDERQAAVEAILGFDHIPAGMELFKAGNESQLNTIKKWIDQSDLYLLILGGRYGSIENDSQKSYTQLEYEYAINKGIPVFSIILSDCFLENKKQISGKDIVYEQENIEKYIDFKRYVKTKMVKEVSEIKDIKIAIYESIRELERDYNFKGWIPGDSYINLENTTSKYYTDTNNIQSIKKEIQILEEKLLSIEVYTTCNNLSSLICIPFYYSESTDLWEEHIETYDLDLIQLLNHLYFYLNTSNLSSFKLKRIIKRFLLNEIKSSCNIISSAKINKTEIVSIISNLCCNNIIKTHKDICDYYSLTQFGKDVIEYLHSH